MTTFLMYTYKDDAELLLITLNQLRAIAGDARIVVVDDLNRPMTKAHSDAVRSLAELQHSTHQRNGNLLGIDHTLYHARKMLELAPSPEDVVVKTDPDTLILGLAWLRQFEADPDAKLVGMFKQWVNYTMGTYAVKGSVLPGYVSDVLQFPPWYQCFEDFEVSSRIHRLTEASPFSITRKTVDGRDGWAMFNYQEARNYGPLVLGCEVVNGGMFVKNPRAVLGYREFLKMVVSEKAKLAARTVSSSVPVIKPIDDATGRESIEESKIQTTPSKEKGTK